MLESGIDPNTTSTGQWKSPRMLEYVSFHPLDPLEFFKDHDGHSYSLFFLQILDVSTLKNMLKPC